MDFFLLLDLNFSSSGHEVLCNQEYNILEELTSTLKMEVICFSEMSVEFHWTA
jgi:hypothetical protein